MAIVPLTNLYEYQSNTGLVIPDTSNVQAQVILGLKNVFGAEFEYIRETPNGLLVDALTQMIKQFVGITAQNVNGLNITTSIGSWLDAIGKLFGVERADDDTDYSYRVKILQSCSRGSGFVQSIFNEIYGVSSSGIYCACVLSNGSSAPKVLPNQTNGIAVDPHSVFVCVSCPDSLNAQIAEAISNTVSIGCGYHNLEGHGEGVEINVIDRGYENPVKFYKPEERFFKFAVSVNSDFYTGEDINEDVASAIRNIVDANRISATVGKESFLAGIASVGKSIVPLGIKIYIKDAEDDAWTETDKYVVMPYQFVKVDDIEVVIE